MEAANSGKPLYALVRYSGVTQLSPTQFFHYYQTILTSNEKIVSLYKNPDLGENSYPIVYEFEKVVETPELSIPNFIARLSEHFFNRDLPSNYRDGAFLDLNKAGSSPQERPLDILKVKVSSDSESKTIYEFDLARLNKL